MKQAVNFRLNKQAILTLSQLMSMLELSKTEIIERDIMRYNERKTNESASPLHALAGSMSDKDSEAMLKSIDEDKVNKNDDLKL